MCEKDNTIYNNVIQLNKSDSKMSKLSQDSKTDFKVDFLGFFCEKAN